jgi:hypothetical protein
MSDILLEGTPLHSLDSAYPDDVSKGNSFVVLSVNPGKGRYGAKKMLLADFLKTLGANAEEVVKGISDEIVRTRDTAFNQFINYDGELAEGKIFGHFFALRNYVVVGMAAYIDTFAVGGEIRVELFDYDKGDVLEDSKGNRTGPLVLFQKENRGLVQYADAPIFEMNKSYGFRIDSVGRTVPGKNLQIQLMLMHTEALGNIHFKFAGTGGGSSVGGSSVEVFSLENIDITTMRSYLIFTPPAGEEYLPLVAYVSYAASSSVVVEPVVNITDASGRVVFVNTSLDSTLAPDEVTPLALEATPPKITSTTPVSLNVVVPPAFSGPKAYKINVYLKMFRFS